MSAGGIFRGNSGFRFRKRHHRSLGLDWRRYAQSTPPEYEKCYRCDVYDLWIGGRGSTRTMGTCFSFVVLIRRGAPSCMALRSELQRRVRRSISPHRTLSLICCLPNCHVWLGSNSGLCGFGGGGAVRRGRVGLSGPFGAHLSFLLYALGQAVDWKELGIERLLRGVYLGVLLATSFSVASKQDRRHQDSCLGNE